MRVLVFGGRDWGHAWFRDPPRRHVQASLERRRTFAVLNRLDMAIGIDVVIHGDYRGADKTASRWAELHGVPQLRFPAHWRTRGRAAGPERNTRMLLEGQPELGVAFPGGVGTSDMLGKLLDAEIPVMDLQGLDGRTGIFNLDDDE